MKVPRSTIQVQHINHYGCVKLELHVGKKLKSYDITCAIDLLHLLINNSLSVLITAASVLGLCLEEALMKGGFLKGACKATIRYVM